MSCDDFACGIVSGFAGILISWKILGGSKHSARTEVFEKFLRITDLVSEADFVGEWELSYLSELLAVQVRGRIPPWEPDVVAGYCSVECEELFWCWRPVWQDRSVDAGFRDRFGVLRNTGKLLVLLVSSRSSECFWPFAHGLSLLRLVVSGLRL